MPDPTAAAPAASAHAPRFCIGVDGGGTGTRARLTDAQGLRLGQGEAGPSSLAQGVDQAWQNVALAVQRAFASAGLDTVPWADCALGLGLAGAHSPQRAQAFLTRLPPVHSLALDSDAGTALLGAHAGQAGLVIAAGTGSVGQALHADGRKALVGGWGFGIGDEGSGAWLGQGAMRQAQAALDGRVASGSLARAVWQRCGADRVALIAWCAQAGQAEYAQLAPLVFESAASDPAADRLLDDATIALVDIARALDPSGQLPVCVMGSIARLLQARFPAALRARCVVPQGDAMEGALHLIRTQLVAAGRF